MSMESLPYDNKSILKTSRYITSQCHSLQSQMNKSFKYTLGDGLSKASCDLTESIYLALDEDIESENKIIKIQEIKKNIFKLLVKLRVCADLGQIGGRSHCDMIQKTLEIKTQADNWLNYIQNKKQ